MESLVWSKKWYRQPFHRVSLSTPVIKVQYTKEASVENECPSLNEKLNTL